MRVIALWRFGVGAYLDFAKSHNMRHRYYLGLYTNFQFLTERCTNELYLPDRTHFLNATEAQYLTVHPNFLLLGV